ncbi:MAG: isoprenyl transferase [Victivallaceae bacterium]|nr:isoprenyl transferase [Victivallaceae bacterium]
MIKHLAIIMDGNGRWAQSRGLSRSEGHRAGAERIGKVVDAAMALGIKYLTVYAFSTENWKRPIEEVRYLMNLIPEFCTAKLPDMMKNGVRLRTIGRTDDLPAASRKVLLDTIEKTKDNDKFTLNIALSYGGRAEIVDAVNKILADGVKPGKIKEADFAKYLYAPDIPDPELMVRTSGEMRLSNFLLWELSYSELYVTETHWPDFDENELKKAIDSYMGRDRRFGGVKTK